MDFDNIVNVAAFFSDTTEHFVTPAQPAAYDRVTIRFRTARNNVDRVFCVHKGWKHLMSKEVLPRENALCKDILRRGILQDGRKAADLPKAGNDKGDAVRQDDFDYYIYELQLEDEKVCYHFEIYAGQQVYFFDSRGPVQEIDEHFAFSIIPGFRTPDWAKGAVMYQIFTDRFCNGDPSNDVETGEYCYLDYQVHAVEDWDRCPLSTDVREFYGGDLQGVLDKLDYLQELGVEVLYFNPLFVSPSNHKYDIQDYDHIDPHLGKIVSEAGGLLPEGWTDNRFATKYINRVTNRANLEASDALFIKLVEEAHSRGMRVLLDGVFNHCGSFNKWMDKERIYEQAEGYEKGAHVAWDSPYRSYFSFHDDFAWPYNLSYDGWWGYKTLPKLNYEGSRALQEYILYIGRKWVSPPFNADGWRLDVAADLGYSPEYNHYFWQEFRKAVKDANPEAIILAEHYGPTSDWLQGKEWDTVMNYDAFMEPVTWFLTGMEKHSDDFRWDLLGNAGAFWSAMHYHTANFAMPSWQCAMNELSNHDHSRFLTRTNHKVGRVNQLGSQAAEQDVNKAVLREAVVIQMTWMGAPTIYYGDEAGVCGFTDPDNRRTYPWGREDHQLIRFHKDITRIRRENDELRRGSLKYVDSDYNFLAYGRFHKQGQCVILINNNDHPMFREVSVWELGIPKSGIMEMLLQSYRDGYTLECVEYEITEGRIRIELPAFSGTILRNRKTENDRKGL